MANDFGELYRELEDPATLTLTNPKTLAAVQVPFCLLRQTQQKDVIQGTEFIDSYWMTAHLWEDNLVGVVPKQGFKLNDGVHDYEVKEVSHDSRRQRFKCLCLRKRP